jgi:hypothetical protein
METMSLMIPNLERIPGDGDAQAREIVHELPQKVNASVAERLDDGAKLALGRYGCRAATLALREGSINRLREALFATALGSAGLGMHDPRDVMIGLALHFDFARRLGVSPSIIFDEVADRLAECPIADLLRDFGMRTDVDLEGFGWQLIDGDAGPDVVPT